ncbi:winged helix DNA-binding domain-containing protein [Planosporangium thailandense]|uniref:Winged helix DNA-binding domain-containing protein n=1 Tax=Planosporangium thailandense TaxID=765197 RepID=A0ABX0Y322_9ACTN|nr:winged helix DNA-binding domain-containing protein [Planosporangium thailandense]NJC71734.1 winged helix DNA-binding domain-containing protein [Planosporangium thailandense]
MRRIGIDERRARLGARHHLAASATASSPAEAAAGVVALHATDPASVFLSVQARTAAVDVEAIERALYEERTLIRMLGMRRTMFVVPSESAPVIQAACARAIAAVQRRKYTQFISDAGLGDGAWLADVEDATARALARLGEATGAQLSAAEPRLRSQVRMAEGKSYARDTAITTWVLFLLAADGRIVRGRPNGSWTSTQWRWSPIERWLPDGMAELAVEDARVELARRWLAAFGPATVADLRWWTGWTATQVKQALAAIRPVEVDLDGETGLVLPDDLEPAPRPEPWVALLPALDPTAMGWQERSWYLGPHGPALFDRSGNVGPTVWADGRIVGGWAQRADGEIVYRLLEDVGSDVASGVEAAVDRLAKWIGDVRVVPRFRTPLERELSA